jgi:hypothetical protein
MSDAPRMSLRYGFTITHDGQIRALTRPAVHGRHGNDTLLIGCVWKVGRKWHSQPWGEGHYLAGDRAPHPTQTAAAKAIYHKYLETL